MLDRKHRKRFIKTNPNSKVNGNRFMLINNCLECKCDECSYQKAKTGRMDTKTKPLYILSTSGGTSPGWECRKTGSTGRCRCGGLLCPPLCVLAGPEWPERGWGQADRFSPHGLLSHQHLESRVSIHPGNATHQQSHGDKKTKNRALETSDEQCF